MKREYKTHIEELNSDRALINRVKKAGIRTYHPNGKYHPKYGYEQLPLVAVITSVGEQRKFNTIKRELEENPIKGKTREEKITAWAKRLVKLYNASIKEEEDYEEEDLLTEEQAEEIARAKLEYKEEQIGKMIERDIERGYSRRRNQLISKMRRENPLRRIEDEDHAIAIVAAHERHTFGYDLHLEEAHEMEEYGEIEKGTAREVARQMYHGNYEY